MSLGGRGVRGLHGGRAVPQSPPPQPQLPTLSPATHVLSSSTVSYARCTRSRCGGPRARVLGRAASPSTGSLSGGDGGASRALPNEAARVRCTRPVEGVATAGCATSKTSAEWRGGRDICGTKA